MTSNRETGSGGRKRNRLVLSTEDRALWEKVKQSATPLHPAQQNRTLLPAPQDQSPANKTPERNPQAHQPTQKQARSAPKAPPVVPKPVVKPKIPGLSSLDRRTVQKIARGTTDIDARIDLHGMTQRDAHGHLMRFLAGSQARGHKVVLVITGKGTRNTYDSEPYREVGVLRRAVPLWLQEPGFRSIVVGYEQAGKGHGGDGALYIRLRKIR